MKNFFKLVLANITAILIFCVVSTVLFFLVIFALSSMSEETVKVKDNTVLKIDSSLNIVDAESEVKESLFNIATKTKNITAYDLVQAINKAKTDSHIRGISLELNFLEAGTSQLQYIRKALEDFKKSGKFVYAYGNTMNQASYYLASVADKIFLHPAGGIELNGLSTEVVMLKDFLDKYGITPQVIRHGKYKAAVEPFISNTISPENRDQLTILLGDIWSQISGEIAQSRKLSVEKVNQITDELAGIIPQSALENKLVDGLAQESEYHETIKKLLKIKKEEKLHSLSINEYAKKENSTDTDGEIGVLYASGNILPGEGFDGIFAENFKKDIKKLKEDDDIKAVVLRINSPGGSANASDEILYELYELKKKKPLVVSFGDYAASGGYYIAMAGQKIFAEPTTITGSIGVFGVIPNFQKIAEKNGIRTDVVQTNQNSNYMSLMNPMSEETKAMITKSVEHTYKRFAGFVMQNRKMTFEQVDALGGGRVWSGLRAKENGLVDELGSLNDAISYAAKLVKIKNPDIISYPAKVSPFEKFFGKDLVENAETKILEKKLGAQSYQVFQILSNDKMMQEKVWLTFPYRVK